MKERTLEFNQNEDKTIVVLSPDNHVIVEKKYKDFNFSLKELINRYNNGDLEEGFKETLLTVSEGNFSDLLKAFGYEGLLKKEAEKRYSTIRSLNEENRELRKQLGEKVSNEDAREKMKLLSETVRKWWRTEGFGHTSDINFTEYGMCKVNLSCMMSGNFRILDDETPISSKGKKKDWIQDLKDQGYKIIPEGGHDWKVVDNDKNRELIIRNISKRFPSSFIDTFENWHGRRETPVIRGVTFYIDNLDDI